MFSFIITLIVLPVCMFFLVWDTKTPYDVHKYKVYDFIKIVRILKCYTKRFLAG